MDEVLTMVEKLTGHQNIGAVRQQIDAFRRTNNAEGEAKLLAKYHARMWDVSAFMKLVKQRFTQWFNGRTGRKGTLWEDRFDSVLVDGAGDALLAMSAYIDLNPVRAGLVKDPKDYRWSGYGEAVAGKRRARLGIRHVIAATSGGSEESITRSMERYRMHVFREGDEWRESLNERGQTARGALKHETVMEVLKRKGRMRMTDYVRCRVRYFCDGAVLGSREFVEGIFEAYRDRFGPKRKTGARRLRGVENELYALRNLQVNVFPDG
jgi:putative transposase